ncbi:DUF2857 domain-containing protein [Salmonella enterica]|uniref:DUF2857 domain-containing protein n=1 Tax=Salmonella enterica TaxID=28901 RepID=UPI001F1BE84B|nr:DUF2857 domain-containing protein [Salmonella enterica]MDJ4288750.1 DUF2857 domain-containing protein [Salmonella enterica]UJJ10555.1 DUF2857 domain-containing protein [Salmonella enterica subsp. enterica]
MFPTLNYVLLTAVLYTLKEGHLRYAYSLGFTVDEMQRLIHLSPNDLFFLSRTSSPFLSIQINHNNLRYILDRAKQEENHQQLIDRAIKIGASHEILNEYFGLNSRDVAVRRLLLGVTIPSGRKFIPDEKTDAEIWLKWKKYRPINLESLSALDIMMHITEALSSPENNLSLTSVRNRIVLFEKNMSEGSKPHA